MQDHQEPNPAFDACAATSKVTPNQRKQDRLKKGQFALLLLVCAGIAAFMLIPNRSKADIAEEIESRPHDLTLAQNLELIEKIKQEERLRLMKQGQVSVPAQRVKPPKLRNHSTNLNAVSKEVLVRMNAPSSFEIENTTMLTEQMGKGGHQAGQAAKGNQLLVGNNPDSQFINSQNEITEVSAKKIPHPDMTVPAGEMIPATLETAINSDLPGMVRAVTTRDVYSLMNGNVLIPRGSTLVGQFSSGVVEGQSRILVAWNRVQMNDGVIVTLNSPGTDTLGRSGQGADYINRRFFERFGTASLLSVLGAYSATAGVNAQDQFNSASQYRMAIANSFQQTAGQTLDKSVNIPPTLQVNQGAKINVFVAHDLDFHNVGLRNEPWPKHVRRPDVWK